MAKNPIYFDEKSSRKIAQVVDSVLRDRGVLTNNSRRRRGLLGGGGGTDNGRMNLGIVTDVFGGNSGVPRYSAKSINNSSIVVTDAHPIFRPFGSDLGVIPGSVGDECILVRDNNEIWQLALVSSEVLATTTCTGQLGEGTINTDNVIGFDVNGNRRVVSTYELNLDTQISITSAIGPDEQFGIELMTFPESFVAFEHSLIDVELSSPTLTNFVRLALATNDATGQIGNDFGDDYHDVSAGFSSVQLTSANVRFRRPCPAKESVQTDMANLAWQRNGIDSTLKLYLNVAPGTSWNAVDSINITGTIWLSAVSIGGSLSDAATQTLQPGAEGYIALTHGIDVTVPGAFDNQLWNTEAINTSVFTHSTIVFSQQVICEARGRVAIAYSTTFSYVSGIGNVVRAKLQHDSGAGFVDVVGTERAETVTGSAGSSATIALDWILDVEPQDKLRFQIKKDGDVCKIPASQSSLTLEYLPRVF